eukprot:CFRG3071T1
MRKSQSLDGRAGTDTEDDDLLMAPAFPVGDIDGFDPTAPPATGEDFLRQVRHEAGKFPATIVAKNVDPRKYDNCQTVALEVVEVNKFCGRERIPSEQWERYALAEFTAASKAIQKFRSSKLQRQADSSASPTKVALPPLSDRTSWRAVFLGTHHSADSPSHRLRPFLHVVASLSHKAVSSLLGLLASELRTKSPTILQLEWTFALLSCLEATPPDISSTLRGIMKVLIDCRANEDVVTLDRKQDILLLGAVNLIITIIGRLFGQLDLIKINNQ